MRMRLSTALMITMGLYLILATAGAAEEFKPKPAGLSTVPARGTGSHRHAARITAATGGLELAGQIGGSVFAVEVQGSYAYIGVGFRLIILDISNPTQPRQVGQMLLPGIIRQITVAGNYAYIIHGDRNDTRSLRIVDISNPSTPLYVSSYDGPGTEMDVVVVDNYAYLLSWTGGLRVLDISNPVAPVEIGVLIPAGSGAIDIAGQYAFVVGAGLQIIDISDPTALAEVTTFEVPQPFDVAVVGNYAYVTTRDAGLRIVDVSDPTAPAEIGVYDTEGSEGHISIAGGYAYISKLVIHEKDGRQIWENSLRIIDISDPARPREVGFYEVGWPTLVEITVNGNYVYMAGSKLWIIDVSNPDMPELAGTYDEKLSWPRDVYVVGSTAYVTKDGGLRIVDISSPATPELVGSFDTLGSGRGIHVIGDYAYLASGFDGLRILDISNPTAPAEIASLDLPETDYFANNVRVAGNYAYVTWEICGDSGSGYRCTGRLQLVDISNRTAPVEVGVYELNEGPFRHLSVVDDYVYLAAYGSGLRIVDVSNPLTPTEVGAYEASDFYAFDVHVVGNYAYVATGLSGLRIVDVSDPTAPVEVTSARLEISSSNQSLQGANYVHVSGSYAYIANGGPRTNVYVLDISNPVEPILIAGYRHSAGSPYGIYSVGNYVYVADGDNGFIILRLAPRKVFLPIVLNNF